MPKKWFQKIMPDPSKFADHPQLKIIAHWFDDPNLWHLNRYSVSTAVSIGAFIAFMPFPGHMLVAALFAIFVRANLPLSILFVWINNPLTMGPMYYGAYKLGVYLLHVRHEKFHIDLSFHWLTHELKLYYEPLLLGSFVCGLLAALLGNLWIRLLWRLSVSLAWRKRAKKRFTRAKLKM